MRSLPTVRRAFADLAHGQIHYRTAGSGTPLLMLHASPGSSAQMQGLIAGFAGQARVIAPDTPGNGDSPALPLDRVEITDLARAFLDFLDEMGLERLQIYGSHTGAAIAVELALMAPERVERVVLDGVQLMTPPQRAEQLERYAPVFTPDLEGTQLLRVFQFCRDQFLFYPWYDRTLAGQRNGGLPAPRDLHDWVVEVLKAGETYHLNYHAAFRWMAETRLPLVTCPALVMAAENDPLFDASATLAPMLPDGRFVALPRFDALDFAPRRKAAMMSFLVL